MKRRAFITLLGGAVLTLPIAARAQERATPIVGYLSGRSASDSQHVLATFRRGLDEAGFAEGRNVTIQHRWAEARYDRLPAMAAELARLPVAVIAASGGNPVVEAAKAATGTIPIVFVTGSDPLRDRLVASLNRPGGNVTGTSFMASLLGAKQLDLLRMMIPKIETVGVLVRRNSAFSESQLPELRSAADRLGLRAVVASAATADDIDTAFAEIVSRRVGALIPLADPLFGDQSGRIATLAARHAVPTMFNQREFVAAGGLMSYGASITDAYRQFGVYVGRILKGEKPADLPVLQPTKFDFALNLRTAKALSLTVPHTVLALADEVIE